MEDNSKAKVVPAKIVEKRQAHQQIETTLKNDSQVILKTDVSSKIISSHFNASDSSLQKVLLEANKIIKIGMAKEVALFEKEAAIQNSNENIDNLRRNILKLQMEYEKLDQNYQNEVSHRLEIIKRMDTTRAIVESTAQYSNVLAKSVKQLQDDKFKLAEFYEMIICNQKDIEEKHKDVEKHVKEIDGFLSQKIEEVKRMQHKMGLDNAEALAKRDRELSVANDKCKMLLNEKEKLTENVNELKRSHLLELENVNFLKVVVDQFKQKNERHKKAWRNKKRRFLALKKKLKMIVKRFRDSKSALTESLSSKKSLEIEKNELKNRMEEQSVLFRDEQKKLVDDGEELRKALSLKEMETRDLESVKAELSEKIMEYEKKAKEWMEKENQQKALHENYLQLLEENQTLKESNCDLTQQNNDKTQLIFDFESKLSIYDSDFKSRKNLFKNEIQKYEELVKKLEVKVSDSEGKLLSERDRNEDLIAQCEKAREEVKSMNDKVIYLENLLLEKTNTIEKYNSEREENSTLINKLKLEVDNLRKTECCKDEELASLNEDYRKIVGKNERLMETIKNEEQNLQKLTEELEKYKAQIRQLDARLITEETNNKTLLMEKNQLERAIEDLKNTITSENEATDDLQRRKTKLEEEAKHFRKVFEENSLLKTSITDLKSRLEGTEARVEVFKALIKKLENEKIEYKESQNQEISHLKAELAALQGSVRKETGVQRRLTSKYDEEQSDKEMDLTGIRKLWEKVKESSTSSSHPKQDNKENEAGAIDAAKPQSECSTPVHHSKKFLSTPRKILTSTPQPRLQTLTPLKKKRDPYEFDSDGSVDRLDADVKSFNPRSKKESASKRQKTKSFM